MAKIQASLHPPQFEAISRSGAMNNDESAPADSSAGSTTLDPALLALLRCPLTRKPLVQRGQTLVCYESRKSYPIEDGIPVLLIEEANDIAPEDLPPEFRDQAPLTEPGD